MAVTSASGEEEVERLVTEYWQWASHRPAPVFPEDISIRFFTERLEVLERRAFLLSCASRVACFVDPGVAIVSELSMGDSNAFSSHVDDLFNRLLNQEQLLQSPLLDRFLSLNDAGVLGWAYGGQGDSLVEELLDPAMNLLKCVFSENGLYADFQHENGEIEPCAGYQFSRAICRIANSMLDPSRFPESDIGGIPPWTLESLEKDSQWSAISMFSQSDSERAYIRKTVEHYSRKCRVQNVRLTKNSFLDYCAELQNSWDASQKKH